ncbi:MAG: acyltransferase family protein [Proteobacteria bacterium]|nr:acyltransferase family protein [Pseudomonadota bacterium]
MTDESNSNNTSLDDLLALAGGLIVKSDSAMRMFKDEVISDIDERLATISKSIEGEEGIDPFGMEPETLRKTAIGAAFLYKLYFRCITRGIENVPDESVIIVANHGGQLPIDGAVITSALMLEKDPPRLLRSMMDKRVPSLPFISTFFSRVGVTVGTTENAQRLLSRGEALLVFPEGIGAISKTVDQAYHLQKFTRGFVRLAISNNTPVVPMAVVGSEEQYPAILNLKGLAKLLGLPSMPIWPQMAIPVLGLLPLPVRYRLQFGEPMHFEGDPDDDDAVIQVMADQVASRITDMLTVLRKERKSIFL